MIKQKVRHELDMLEYLDKSVEKAPEWRNRWFLRNGKSYFGSRIYDSVSDAELAGLKSPSMVQPKHFFLANVDHDKLGVPHKTYRHADISHFIPMPVTE